MSRRERLKFILAACGSIFVTKERVEREMKRYEEQSSDFVDELSREFPAAKEVIIDARDRHMATAIQKLSVQYNSLVAVVGDGHIPGLEKILSDSSPEVIRLSQLRGRVSEASGEDSSKVTISYEYELKASPPRQ